MFSLREFVKRGLLDAVGKQSDWWIILNAAGWLEKGVLTEDDLAEIQEAIDEKNTPAPEPEPVVEEPPVVSEPVVEPVESESDTEDEGADAEDEQPAPESDGE